MERFALAGLLAVAVPSLAPAQRVEIAVWGGAHQPTPRVREGPTHVDCIGLPCPYYFRDFRSSGTALAVSVTFPLGPNVGVATTIQRSHAFTIATESQSPGSEVLSQWNYEYVATFLTIQPRIRVRVDELLELAFGLGPAVVTFDRGSTDLNAGFAGSAALRVRMSRALWLEFTGSNTHLAGRGRRLEGNRNHVLGGVGLAFALNQ